MEKTAVDTRNLILCALFAALIAVGAFIRIPVPIIPFTLQLFFVTMAGYILGPRWGAASAAIYLLLGLMGLPIFTEGGGLGYVLKPSFGYLIGFVVSAYVVGKIATPQASYRRLVAAAFAGLLVAYIFGLAYCYFCSNVILGLGTTAWSIFIYGFVMIVPGDFVLCFVAAFLAARLRRQMRFMQ